MNKIYLLLLCMVILWPNRLIGQDNIFTGGLHIHMVGSQIDGDQMGGYNKIGLSAGGFVYAALSGKMALGAGLEYSGRGGRQDAGLVPIGYKPLLARLHYVDLPMHLLYRPVDEWQVSAGIGVGYLFYSKLKDNNGNVVSPDLYQYNDFDLSSQAGVNYYLSENMAVSASFVYSLNLIRESPQQKNRAVNVGIRRFF